MDHNMLFAVATTTVPAVLGKEDTTMRIQAGRSLRLMASQARELGMRTVAIHPSDTEWRQGHVYTWTPQREDRPHGAWVARRMPTPDVLYENVFVHLVVRGAMRELRAVCQQHGVRVFNPLMHGKQTVSRLLEATPSTSSFIPRTKLAQSPEDVLQYCAAYGTAYLKPVDGSGGNGVVRIEQVNQRGSRVYRVEADRSVRGPFRWTLSEVATRKVLRKWLSGKKHIVQQGLKLLTLDEGQVDFRVVVQRDDRGQWHLVGIVPKVAKAGGVVTNVIAGGRKETLNGILQRTEFRRSVSPEELEHAAILIAQRLAEARPAFGVAGFDMGIDGEGKTWMIEMNPKPSRKLLTPAMRERSFAYCAQFAHFLGNQSGR